MRLYSLALLTLVACALPACDTNKKAPTPAPGGTDPAMGQGQLPPGHPPLGGDGAMGSGMGGGMAGMGAAPRGEAPLTWQVPSGWQETPPANSMRIAQFEIAEVGGKPVECKLFGGIMGGVDANIQRWVGFFTTADGGPIGDAAKITKTESNGLKITTLDVSGVFSGGMTPTEEGAEPVTSRMLASVIEGVATPVQVQLVGPADVIAEHADRYQSFVNSLTKK